MSKITFELILPSNEDKKIEAEDGTVYYRSDTSLYTITHEGPFGVLLSSPQIELRGSVGSALYFYTKEESKSSGIAGLLGKKKEMHVFYKTAIEKGQLTLLRVNEIAVADDVEIFPEQPFYAIKKGAELTVYRFEEQANESRGMKFDIMGSEGATTGFRLIHRGKLILTQTSNDASLCHVSNSVKLLRMPLRVMGIHLHDDSDVICLLLHSQKEVIIINTRTLRAQTLKCAYDPAQPNSPAWDFAPADIVSVRDGVLMYTVGPQKNIGKTEPRQLWRGKLPDDLL